MFIFRLYLTVHLLSCPQYRWFHRLYKVDHIDDAKSIRVLFGDTWRTLDEISRSFQQTGNGHVHR